jgi:hypothetical protein
MAAAYRAFFSLVLGLTVVQGGRKTTDEENDTCHVPEPWERPVKRTVALAGATGLVGRSNLEGLLADTSVQSVHVRARCKSRVVHSRLTCHIVDFAALSPLPPVAEVYLALGTTIKVAGSQAAFRAVDFDANPASRRELEKTRDAALTPFLSAIAARRSRHVLSGKPNKIFRVLSLELAGGCPTFTTT